MTTNTIQTSNTRTQSYKMRNNPAYTVYNASIAILKTPPVYTPEDQKAMRILKQYGY